ncbi:heavy-metal-associated domain-containing protein [Flavisolibacter nicotianae]|uniref:heavy-metal-associated domain-containing protein n=1 Tax=Flavisolibacter nicotianae TaxID=2364882 RepID=UPI000EB4FB54|nr:heavy-metal-associated domain-containing protein [Flavisolibacter nicotianae]
MEAMKFKTNIKCSGCIATVTPFLNKTVGENSWNVDVQNPDKVLAINRQDVPEEEVVRAVQDAGYKAEKIG